MESSNYRVVTSDDVTKYGDLLGAKKEGDTITAAESFELDEKLAKRTKTTAPQVVTPAGVPAAEDESEAAETTRTRRSKSTK